MKKPIIYLDVCCLNRPEDDLSQLRVQQEAEAVLTIVARAKRGEFHMVSSEAAVVELEAMKDAIKLRSVKRLLPDTDRILRIDAAVEKRAGALLALGFQGQDAVHVAAAEACNAAVLLSCDDRLCKLAARHGASLKTRIANPISWLGEQSDEQDG